MNRLQILDLLLCLSHVNDANRSALELHSNTSHAQHIDQGFSSDFHDRAHDVDADDGAAYRQQLVAKVVVMAVLFVCSVLCGSVPFLLSRCLNWTESKPNSSRATAVRCLLYFGGGVLLCTTFLHLLPEVQKAVGQLQECGALPPLPFELAEMLMCGGLLLMCFIDELIHAYMGRQRKQADDNAAGAAFERGHSLRASRQWFEDARSPANNDAVDPAHNSRTSLDEHEAVAHNQSDQNLVNAVERNLEKKHAQYGCHGHEPAPLAHSHLHLPPPGNSGSDPDATFVASSLRGALIVLALSLHELFEGMAIGLEHSTAAVWFMFGAVSAHKLVLAFCVGVELIVARTGTALAMVYVFTFAVVSPVGIGIGILISHHDEQAALSLPSVVLQGLACGTLLYVIFFEIFSQRRAGFFAHVALLVGFVVMFALQMLGHDEHGHSHGGCGNQLDAARGHQHSHQHHHQHELHHDRAHIASADDDAAAANSEFQRELEILRSISKQIMENLKKVEGPST